MHAIFPEDVLRRMKSKLLFKPGGYLALAVYIAAAYSVLAMGSPLLALAVPEDHYFEIIGASALLATSLLFLYGFKLARKMLDRTWRSLVKQLVYLALAFLFFVGAGEEISWGQRMLGFGTPEAISQVNRQEEFNLHNLSAWEASRWFDADRLFDLFWFLFCVFTPMLSLVSPWFRRFARQWIPIVHWGVSLLFLFNYLSAKLAKLMFEAAYSFDRVPFAQAVQEIKESNYAVLFILVGLHAILDLKRSRVEPGRSSLQGTSVNVEPVFHD
jgi:hypothetical protein